MAVNENLTTYSTTAGSNTPAGSDAVGTDLDDHLRDIKKNVRYASMWRVQSKTGSYTATISDHASVLAVAASAGTAATITLPAAATAGDGWRLGIKLASGSSVTIDANGAETIDGSLSASISIINNALTLVCDGSNWQSVAEAWRQFDLGGRSMILDADDDSTLTADTDDQLDLQLGGTDHHSWTTTTYTLTGTDAGAAVGPIIDLYRNSASPADSDAIGQILFSGEDSAGAKVTYAYLAGEIDDVTDSEEDGSLYVWNNIAGTVTHQAKIGGTQNNFLNDVYIGNATTAPSATLHVYDTAASGAKTVRIEVENADATEGPILEVFRTSSSPDVSDTLGSLYFSGKNDATQDVAYGLINTYIQDETDTTEDGVLRSGVVAAGSSTYTLTLYPTQSNIVTDTYIGSSSTAPSAPLHVYDTNAASSATVRVEVQNADATEGPIIQLYRNSSSPDVLDTLGSLYFSGKNSTGGDEAYGLINTLILDPVVGTGEDGQLRVGVISAGATSYKLLVGPTATNILEDTYIGSATTAPSAPLHVYDTVAAVDTVLIEVEEASANPGPLLTLFRNSSSIAVSDSLGRIVFRGQNNEANAETDYTIISTNITNATSGTEAGELLFTTRTADTLTTQFKLGQGFYATTASSGDMGTGTVNAKAVYDDGAGPLTDYVMDYAVDGFIDYDWYDNDEFGSAKAREWDPQNLDIDAYVEAWTERKALPPFKTKEQRAEGGRAGIGETVQGLVETVEVMAAHIGQLNARIKTLETVH